MTWIGTPGLGPLTIDGGLTISGDLSGVLSATFKGPRPWIDVRAYGAKGDGVTDDTAAIQAAINAAPANAVVVFPQTSSNYQISSSLILPSNITLQGLGLPTIKVANGATALNSTGVFQATSKDNIVIQSLKIDGNKANQTVPIFGIVLTNTTNAKILDDFVSNTSHEGIFLDGTTSNAGYYVARARVENVGSLSIVPGGSAGIDINSGRDTVLDDVTVVSSSGHGIAVALSNYVKIFQPKIYSAGKRGISATGQYIDIYSPLIRSSGWTGIQIGGTNPTDHVRVFGGTVELSGQSTPFVEGDGVILSGKWSELIGVVAQSNGLIAGATSEMAGMGCTADFCRIIGGTSENNGDVGIVLFTSSHSRIVGTVVRNNGQTASAVNKRGILISNDGITPSSDNIIENVRSYDDQGTKTQTYGIGINAGTVTNSRNRVLNSNLTGNATGAYSDASGATGINQNQILSTIDVNPAAPSTVTAGSSVWTYTNNDGYPELMTCITNCGNISMLSWKGQALVYSATAPPTLLLQPGDTMAVTWNTAAPTFYKVPQ